MGGTRTLVTAVVFFGAMFIAIVSAASPDPEAAAAKDTHAHEGEQSNFTLKEVMQHLGAAQSQLHLGLLSHNRLMIANGAKAIAHHPMPKGGLKPYIKKNHQQLMPTIKEMDQRVHSTAVEIFKRSDRATMVELQALNDRMVVGCLSCHELFRD